MDFSFCGIFSILISILAIIVASIYLFFKYTFTYWARRGVKYVPPTIPYGNFAKNFKREISMCEEITELYRNTNEHRFIGIFAVFRPILLVNDPALIQQILVKDFAHFTDHGVYSDKKNDPLSAHLFAINGEEWKNVRAKIAPAFTPGKLKAMFSTIVDCGKSFQNVCGDAAEQSTEIDVRELAACYSTNVIASVAFGLDIDCVADPNTPFRKYGRKFFTRNWKTGFKNFAKFLSPKIIHLLGLKILDPEIENFFLNVVQQTMDLREKHNIVRKDFFQLLIQLRNTGSVQEDDEWKTKIINNEHGKLLAFEDLAAHAFVFYIAGFETTSTTISFCLFELAKHPEFQRKAQEEIDAIMKKYNNEISYEAINEMKFVGSCIEETLRFHTPLGFINRICTKEYRIPGTDIVLDKGTAVLISSNGLHHDERFYLNPEEFNPYRFYDGNLKDKPFTEKPFFPFGDGPRVCIGMRLGLIEIRVGLAMLLQNFNYTLGNQHIGTKLKYSPIPFVTAPATGLMLKVNKRVQS